MARVPRVLVISQTISPFISQDFAILKKHFDVKSVRFILDYKNPLSTLSSALALVTGTLWSDLTFSWFADVHAKWAVRLSRLFGKKSLVIVGGYEVVNIPEIGYGGLINSKSANIVKYVLNNADRLLAVSEYNRKLISNIVDPKKISLVYNGVDCEQLLLKANDSNSLVDDGQVLENKENLVITVVYNINEITIRLKGLRTFIDAAMSMPETRFLIIGNLNTYTREKLNVPNNVEFTGFLDREDLYRIYSKSKVYCQLSLIESFGMALAEAMCFGCVPVVTCEGALPEVVGDTGYYVPYGDTRATVAAIREALTSSKGLAARARVTSKFSIRKRERALVNLIRDIIAEKCRVE